MNTITIHKIRNDHDEAGNRYSVLAGGFLGKDRKLVNMSITQNVHDALAEQCIVEAIDFFNAMAESDLEIKVERYDLSKYVPKR